MKRRLAESALLSGTVLPPRSPSTSGSSIRSASTDANAGRELEGAFDNLNRASDNARDTSSAIPDLPEGERDLAVFAVERVASAEASWLTARVNAVTVRKLYENACRRAVECELHPNP